MIHCGPLWLKKCKWTSKKWLAYLFLQILTQKSFKIFPCRVTFKLVHCCTSAKAYTSLILTLKEIVPLVDCRGLYRFAYISHPCNHFNEYIYYCIDIHYRAAGNTAGKHGSPVAFSSRWKHFSATAAVALETWSLSLFYPHSSLLASLSALLLAIRIKPAAGLAVLKCSLQLNTFK